MVLVGRVVMFSITRTTYNAVNVFGSRRPHYNGAAVYHFYLNYLDRRACANSVGQNQMLQNSI